MSLGKFPPCAQHIEGNNKRKNFILNVKKERVYVYSNGHLILMEVKKVFFIPKVMEMKWKIIMFHGKKNDGFELGNNDKG